MKSFAELREELIERIGLERWNEAVRKARDDYEHFQRTIDVDSIPPEEDTPTHK